MGLSPSVSLVTIRRRNSEREIPSAAALDLRRRCTSSGMFRICTIFDMSSIRISMCITCQVCSAHARLSRRSSSRWETLRHCQISPCFLTRSHRYPRPPALGLPRHRPSLSPIEHIRTRVRPSFEKKLMELAPSSKRNPLHQLSSHETVSLPAIGFGASPVPLFTSPISRTVATRPCSGRRPATTSRSRLTATTSLPQDPSPTVWAALARSKGPSRLAAPIGSTPADHSCRS